MSHGKQQYSRLIPRFHLKRSVGRNVQASDADFQSEDSCCQSYPPLLCSPLGLRLVHGRATGTVVSAGKAVGADNVAGATVGAWHIGTLPPLWPRRALPATVFFIVFAWLPANHASKVHLVEVVL